MIWTGILMLFITLYLAMYDDYCSTKLNYGDFSFIRGVVCGVCLIFAIFHIYVAFWLKSIVLW